MFLVFGGRRYALDDLLGLGGGGGTFEQTYRCLPPSAAANPHLEDGDRVLLPPSALHRLTSLHVDYPMLFELRSGSASAAERASHCGVLEFVAMEGTVVMPRWMMSNLRLDEGDHVSVRTAAALPKGTYVKFRPHEAAFLDVSNPKAVLEKTLRAFTCLTTGDTIMVSYNGKSYYIDIVETRPAAAVSIIETDCEVDFAPPLDYEEPEKPAVRLPPAPAVVPAPASGGKAPPAGDGSTVAKDEPMFKPFAGFGKRLDGKASAAASEGAAASADACSAAPSGSNNGKRQQASAPSSSGRQKTGKLVFGSSSATGNVSNSEEAQKAPVKQQQAEEPPKTKDEPKFQAFTGKGYSLKR
ncbi:unnamed protein product [Urochloa decumbens]|uniref:Ubiquitin fusion degradation protein 1 n=1 Tax=Urochloa decumbens TaxID=240449 RepID=A0ABC8W252_9POAL